MLQFLDLVAQPSASGPDQCTIVDGAAFYDNETDIWHYLGQCIAQDAVWNMCHYYIQGSPYGDWVVDPANPVVRSGQLWSQICSGSGKHCSPTMGSKYLTYSWYSLSKLLMLHD